MKNIIVIALLFLLQTPVFAGSYLDKQLKESNKNVKYSTVQKYTAVQKLSDIASANEIELKDPKLIALSDVKPVDVAAYKAKIAQDESVYKSTIKPSLVKNGNSGEVDFYNVYRIAERLIRANNLDYMNWRIAIRKSSDSFNAATTAGNFIYIHTALYDSLYTNNDALAFVIAHEMSHQILGHQQRTAELYNRMKRTSPNTWSRVITENQYNSASRTMEFMADAQGAELLVRAGFNMDNAMEAFNFMNILPNIDSLGNSHPHPEKRIASIMENRAAFPQEWVNEGKANIMDSEVLSCKKSSDRVSIIIEGNPHAKKYFAPEPIDQKLTRIAYSSYKNRNMVLADKYFKKLADMKNSYVAYLYISYANEYLYRQFKDEKYLKEARKAAKKAAELNPSDADVKSQLADLNAL